MAPDVGRQAVEAVFRSAKYHQFSGVKLKYGGGEPTLRFPMIVDLQGQARKLARLNNLKLDAVILSNGLGITESMVKAMKSLGLRLTISLDGLGTWHDRQRSLADGQGSFTAVAQSITLLLQNGFVPGISVTVTGRNLPGLVDLVGWLLDRDLPFRIEFYRETEHSTGADGLAFEEQALIETMQRAFQIIETRLPRWSLLASLVDRVNLSAPHLYPCGAGNNYLVIKPRGGIAKCQMDMDHVVTDISDPDPLGKIRADTAGIHNLPVSEKEGCNKCAWRQWCAGGCPLVTYQTTGRYDVRSPNCKIYQALCPEVMRLEGLRLLKYAKAEPR